MEENKTKTMKQNSTLFIEITPKRNTRESIGELRVNQELLRVQEAMLRSINRLHSHLAISLRYHYFPDQHTKLKIYLLIRQLSNSKSSETLKAILNLLEVQLHKFFMIESLPNYDDLINLQWVQHISEIVKYEESNNTNSYYLVHPFTPNESYNSSFCDYIESLRRKIILEITIRTYQNNERLINAIQQMSTQLQSLSSSETNDPLLSTALNLYQHYKTEYISNDLFEYSIKTLAENSSDATNLLNFLINDATSAKLPIRQPKIIEISQEQPSFCESLQASQEINLSTSPVKQLEGWEKLTSMKITSLVKSKTDWMDKYMTDKDKAATILPENPTMPTMGKLLSPSTSKTTVDPNQGDNALTNLSSLVKVSSHPLVATMADLKPLHRLVTLQEISGFFRLAVPKGDPRKMNFITMSAEELFSNYQHLISQDTYIVGIDDERNPIISSWAEIPHRLVAGVPGSGKTNFLNWVVFQFLYATKNQGKIYIADFAGLDFNFLEEIGANVQIVKTVEECEKLIEIIHTQEYENRLTLMQNYGVQNLRQLQEEVINIERTLWIIDEAADIANASWELKETIEKRLKDYARKGRKFGIHIIYCTQRPTGEIISGQVTDQCEEKIVFRVSLEGSQLILDNNPMASNIPKTARGRAVLRGSDADNIFVNTPFIPVPVGTQVKLTDTLWYNIPNLTNN